MQTQDFYAHINYLAVLVSAIAYFAIGALWYSPVLFGKMWMEAKNVQPDPNRSGMAKLFITTFILNLLCVFIAATFVSALGANSVADGINLGVRIALGFAVSTMGINYMYDNKPAKLFWIDSGYHIVGIVVAAIILSVWK